MAEDTNQASTSSKSEPITFGSCISISLSGANSAFVTSEGFINSKLYVKKFDENNPSHNFACSVFRILPFDKMDSFRSQTELYDLIENFHERAQELSSKDLKERKQKIQNLRSNLDAEISANITSYNKAKGTAVHFATSTFQLVHVATMKYLSLNDTIKDNLYFDLVDYPNDKSFFRFNPSLRLQKQRNNFVYNQDLVVISSTKQILNRYPTLYTSYEDNSSAKYPVNLEDLGEAETGKVQRRGGKIVASIEDTKKWRLNLYQFETSEDQDSGNFLQVGDVVWLNLSERGVYMNVTLGTDPFEKLMAEGKSESNLKRDDSEEISRKGSSPQVSKFGISRQFERENQARLNEMSLVTSADEDIDNGDREFIEKELVHNLTLIFTETSLKRTGKSTEYVEMTTNGLWRIEPQNIFEGGYLSWDNVYRLRHLTTGRYLKTDKRQNEALLSLSLDVDDDCLFFIIPLENLLKDDANRRYISKDAYFRLQHANTREYVSLQEESIGGSIKDDYAHNEQNGAPSLTNKVREIDTFKMVKADYEEIWETNFLLSAFPILTDLRKHFAPMKGNQLTKEQKNFEEVAERVLTSLENLSDFTYNKLPGNIALNQEFALVSPMRQRILREQNILGIVCWLLCEGFPTEKELQKIGWKLLEPTFSNSAAKAQPNIGAKLQYLYKSPNMSSNKQRLEKIETDQISKRYKICYHVYELLKTMCSNNPENQQYAFKFVNSLIQHLGYGRFVSKCLQVIFSENTKILYSLHKSSQKEEARPFDALGYEGNDKKSYLNNIVNKIKGSKNFEHRKILDLLNQVCFIKDRAIHINQDKIFKLVNDESFRNNQLINMTNDKETLMVDFKVVKVPLESFFKNGEIIKQKDEMKFLRSQLELFASLSMDRNSTSNKHFSKIFTLKALMNYMFNEDIPEKFRATFVRLLSCLHIDKEPRMNQDKPNLVRIVELPTTMMTSQPDSSSPVPLRPRRLNESNGEGYSPFLRDGMEIQSALARAPLINESREIIDEEEDFSEEKELLGDLKSKLLSYLANKASLFEDKSEKKGKIDIFNIFTLEILRMVFKMLRFGLFNQQRKELGDASRKEDRSLYESSDVEKLIKCLTPTLEYDEAYFQSVKNAGIKRKVYVQEKENAIKKSVQSVKEVFGGVAGLAKSLGGLLNVGGTKEDKKDRSKALLNLEVENEGIKDQIFKKPESLKKILLKFSNKTFTKKDDDNEENIETQTKKLICDVFQYIMDMRQDFLLENVTQYFKKHILQSNTPPTPEEIDKHVSSKFETLFPESFLEAGTDISTRSSKLENYTQQTEIRSFDQVLKKSFVESLLMGFFFANSATVQNAILALLRRCCKEKKNLQECIEKLELLFSVENKKLYNDMDEVLKSLKSLIANSQSWLQIMDMNTYAKRLTSETYAKLSEIKKLFEECVKNPEQLNTRQNIFKHMGGHKVIFQLFSKSMMLFDSFVEMVKGFTSVEQSQRFIHMTEILVNIFKVSHSILEIFCLKNIYNQKALTKEMTLLLYQKSINLGQMELISQIYTDNILVAKTISENCLKYFITMIKIHGRKQIFLKVYETLTNQDRKELNDTYKRILIVLLNDQVLSIVNPCIPYNDGPENHEISGFEPDASPLIYTSSFLQILSKCVQGDVGINLISKAYQALPISYLMELLLKVSQDEMTGLANPETDLSVMPPRQISEKDNQTIERAKQAIEKTKQAVEKAKLAILSLILTFIQESSRALYELSKCHGIMMELIKIETTRLEIPFATVSPSYKLYILEGFVPAMNIYHEKFLMDVTAMLGAEEDSNGQRNFETKRTTIGFVTKLLAETKSFINNNSPKDIAYVKELLCLSVNFKIEPPRELVDMEEEYEKNQNENAEEEEEEDGNGSGSNLKVRKKETSSFGGVDLLDDNDDLFDGKPKNFLSKIKNKSAQIIKKSIKVVFKRKDSYDKQLSVDLSNNSGPEGVYKRVWIMFKDALMNNNDLKKAIKNDINVLSNSILKITSIYEEQEDDQATSNEVKDLYITSEDLLIKFFVFIEFWVQKKADKQLIIFLIKALGRIIKNLMPNENDEERTEQENRDKKEDMVKKQDMLDRLSATKIIVVLIWNEREDDYNYIYSLISFAIKLLYEGNKNVQKNLYDFFHSNSAAEKFFRKISNFLQRQTTESSSTHSSSSKEESKLLSKVLRLLQLFCEGHYTDLQNYLRHQTHSKNSYDLIAMTIKVLVSLKLNKNNYETAMQCFDTLTEFIQGPCKENQLDLVNDGKFLTHVVSLLSEDEKVIEYYGTKNNEKLSKGSRSIAPSQWNASSRDGASTIADRRTKQSGKKSYAPSQTDGRSRATQSVSARRRMKIEAYQLARVKFKSLITVVSLLELNNDSTNILIRIQRMIPIGILTKNLVQVYEQYTRNYKNKEYTIKMFDKGEDENNKDEFIIENGFHIYTLLNLLIDNDSRQGNDEDDEIGSIIKHDKRVNKGMMGMLKNSVIGELASFSKSMVKGAVKGAMDVTKELSKRKLPEDFNKETFDEILKADRFKTTLHEAVKFFKSKMAHIEIIREDKLEKIYFPILPFCSHLPDKTKKEFHEGVNRTSTKTKLNALMTESEQIIRVMKKEESLQKKFQKYKLIGFVSNYQSLWEYGAFYTNIFLNIIIISSYSNKYPNRLNDPHIFFINRFSKTQSVIYGVGVTNIVFSMLVVVLFLFRRAPLLYEPIWEGFSKIPWSIQKVVKLILNVITTLYCWFTDFDFSYYITYILFSFLGLFVHPFFFVFQLTDILRIELLKNVVRAVWRPRIPLLLTGLVFILLEYYFSLLGYSVYNDHYVQGKCDQLWKCFLTTFDQTFKQGGAVGAYLTDPRSLDANGNVKAGYLNIGRFFFDNSFYAILVLIIINMVAGIIIDTFGALKDQLSEKEEDITQYCFICGFDRERLDKSSTSKQGFDVHIKFDHYLWNYVFYKAFLKHKKNTEFNGNETYVSEKIEKHDLSWLPAKRTAAIKDEVEESNEKVELIKRITTNMGELKSILSTGVTKMNRALETSSKN